MYILYSRDAGISSMGNLREDRSVWPDELYEEQRESLLKVLKSCGESRENPAIVQVRGFASAGLAESAVKENLEYAYKKVGTDDEKFSKAFNLYIAEKRAENLVTKIKEMIGDKKKHRHIFMQMEKLPGNGD